MNPKKGKEMFFDIDELSEVEYENMYLGSEYITQEETNKALFYHRFCIIILFFSEDKFIKG